MNEPSRDPVESLFDHAIDLPHSERAAFLDAACAGNPDLRAEVEGLLACDEEASPDVDLLEHSPVQRIPRPAAGRRFGPPAAEGEVGTLGPYRVLRPLGRGGMGTVYAALDPRLNRQLALKVMLPRFAANPAAKERFLREARAAAQVSHDNVVTVYEADERDGIPYIAMPLLDGCTLDQHIRDKGVPPIAEAMRIAFEAADGLAAAHRIGLVHRDVKPANLWLEAPHGRVKVLDFGLAKPLDAHVGVTVTGTFVGTPAYMSPEQARGEKVDHRTDLFSLGAVLYRLCGGRLPFEGPSTIAVLMALGTEEPPPLRGLNPLVPAPLEDLIHRMLAKKPDDRPQSAAEVSLRLRAIADGTAYSISRTEDRSARASTARRFGIAAVLAIASGGAILVARTGDAPASRPTASIPATSSAAEKILAPTTTAGQLPAVDTDNDRSAATWVLSLGGTVRVNGDDRGIRTPAELPADRFALTSINLRDNKAVTDAGLSRLRALSELTLLDLQNTPVTDAGLPHLSECRNLATLWLSDTAVTGAGLVRLETLQRLSELHLGRAAIYDADLGRLAGLKGLTRLFLQATRVTDDGLVHLREMKALKHVDLFGTPVTDGGMAHLLDCPGLTVVGLGATRVGDAGLALVGQLSGLVEVTLDYTPVTDAGLEHLKGCRAMKVLNLGGTAVTDVGLACVRGFPELTELTLQGTRITDATLANLKECRGLQLLRLDGTAVTDAGLEHLAKLVSLTLIQVRDTRVTAEGLTRFHAVVPQCQIDHSLARDMSVLKGMPRE